MKEKIVYNDTACKIEQGIAKDRHVFSIYAKGVKVGYANLFESTHGHIEVTKFKIYENHVGKKNGSKLIEAVNQYLISKKKNGFLMNLPDDKSFEKFYENHGWERQDGISSKYLEFNYEKHLKKK